jgi:glutamyl-tRNA synthetase
MIRVRFATTPSGNLFLNGARVALANDLFAQRGQGTMLLRLDDLDLDRCRPMHVDQMMQDLRWFGINWQESYRQSERLELYQDRIERLKRDKFIYPCFESEEELKAKLEFRRKRHQPPIYDRAMLSLTDKQRTDAEAGGKRPHWRFKLSGRTLEWHDLVQGPKQATLSTVSDPILVRADGRPTPILASVIDDVDSHITHIIRTEDNAGNTAVQIELFEVLVGSHKGVRFGHLPVLHDTGKGVAGGRKLGHLALRALRNDGVEPLAIAACLMGVAADVSGGLSLQDLVQRLALADLARAGLDIADMLAVNRRLLRTLDFAAVVDRLPEGATEAFWLAVRGNLDLLKEARGWWDVVAGTIIPPVVEGARDLLLTAEALLPLEPWDTSVWMTWMTDLERATGQTGEALVLPLRLALTGEDSGPDLADLLPLIGRPRTASRLLIAAA